jgi:hypothetical protein
VAIMTVTVCLAGCSATTATPAPTGAPTTSTTTSTTAPADAATCTYRPPKAPVPVRPGLSATLVPPGSSVATLCHYSGVGQSGGTIVLQRSRAVSGTSLAALVAYLDSPHWQVVTSPGPYSCPMWNGATDLVLFVYPSGPGVSVSVDIGGCGFATNGALTVEGYAIGQHLAALADA